MKRLRFCLTLTLALLLLGSGAWTQASHTAASVSLVPSDLTDESWQAIQSQVAKLTAVDGDANDFFGRFVSVSADTAVVGAPWADIGGSEYQGAAYIFYRNQGGSDAWGQVAKLTAADGAYEDYFGWSVSVDGYTAVVGAIYADVGGNWHQGAAYVFYRDQGGPDAWGQVAKLTSADGAAEDHFGESVSVNGDTTAVGANLADVSGTTDQGAAYVFYRDQGGTDAWGQVAKLTSADGMEDDFFGMVVSVSGSTALAGAPGSDIGGDPWQGAAYVFYRDQGGADSWSQVVKLTTADPTWGDMFGNSVSVDGDMAVVGAPSADVGGSVAQGAAYVFYRNQGGADAWGQVAKLTATDGAANDNFGSSISVDNDTAVVGVPQATVGVNVAQGAAYVFCRDQGGSEAWGEVTKLTAADGAGGDKFGWSESVSGSTVVAGAYLADIGTKSDQGAAFVFYTVPSLVPPDSLIISGATQGAIGTSYPFTAIVSPENATLPITYVWQATGQAPVTHTGGLIDLITFAWATTGNKAIDVTATNAGGQVIGTHNINIYAQPVSVIVSGTTQGAIGTSYPFTAIVSPENATLPITYVWQATGQAPMTHTGGLTDLITFAWATAGNKAIDVTATNAGGQVIGTHNINVYAPPMAVFTASLKSGVAPLTVNFTDMSTGAVNDWLWDFGDTFTSTQQHPMHTYTGIGVYTVTLAVSGFGGTDTLTHADYITVVEGTKTIVDPTTGGTLVYTGTQGVTTTIQIPAGAVTETTTLIYAVVDAVTAPSGLVFAGHAFDLNAYQDGVLLPGFTFLQPVTITIYYTDADIAGLDENSLKLYYLDNVTWKDVAQTCSPPSKYERHPGENWFSIIICHLSRFGLFGKEGHIDYLPLVRR